MNCDRSLLAWRSRIQSYESSVTCPPDTNGSLTHAISNHRRRQPRRRVPLRNPNSVDDRLADAIRPQYESATLAAMNAVCRLLNSKPKASADWVRLRLADLMLLKDQGRIHVVRGHQYVETSPGVLSPAKVVFA